MDRDSAAGLMAEIVKLGAQLNVIMLKVEELDSESDRLMMRGNIAKVLMANEENLYRPILQIYPDLEPLNE